MVKWLILSLFIVASFVGLSVMDYLSQGPTLRWAASAATSVAAAAVICWLGWKRHGPGRVRSPAR
jgi:hypothetical protein